MHFEPALTQPENSDRQAWWFIFRRFSLLVQLEDGEARLPLLNHLDDLGLTSLRQQYLGLLDDRPCFSVEISDDMVAPDGWSFQGLRSLYGSLTESLFWVAGAAVQIVDWDRTHQYCGRCGNLTTDKAKERAKECTHCGLVSYPRISPAIIVLIEKGDELLLARSHRHPSGMYSVLAGFVEPGETLEAAVAREIKEEVGIQVEEIRYFGSQPWPFPNSLMIAFTCKYAGGEIVLEEEEMAEAGWYTADNLPRIPPRISIARQLIDWFVARQKQNHA